MSHKINDKSKEIVANMLGIPYEELINLDEEQIDEMVKNKTGKKLNWSKVAKVGELPLNRSKINFEKKSLNNKNKSNNWER